MARRHGGRQRGTPGLLAAAACLLAVIVDAAQPELPPGLTEQQLLPDRVWRPATPAMPMDHPLLAHKSPDEPHTPEQVHVGLAGPGAAAISWVTHPHLDAQFMGALAGVQAAASPQELDAWSDDAANKHHHRKQSRRACKKLRLAPLTSQVLIGTQPGNYINAVNGTFTCYSSYDYVSGALHHVVVGGGQEGPLAPGTTYYYAVGDPLRGLSPELSFKTPAAPGSQGSFPMRVALIGDLGQTPDSRATVAHAANNTPDLVVNVGDLSYADGFQPRWDTYGRMVEPFSSSVPSMAVEGNHELEIVDGDKTFVSYLSRYYQPYRESGSLDPLYYSFEAGGAHFVMLGSYAAADKNSDQFKWLLEDLSRVDRSRTPWLIAAMHCPWYNSNTAHYGEGDEMQATMERALYEHGADAVFSGHVHAYERMERVFHNRRNACGPMHINIGDGGNWEGLDVKYLRQPKWSAFREPTFGHGMLLLHNATHATWEWHRNSEGDPVVGDSVLIVRSVGREACRAAGPSQKGDGSGGDVVAEGGAAAEA